MASEAEAMDVELIRELRLLLEAAEGTPSAWAASQVVICACTPRWVFDDEPTDWERDRREFWERDYEKMEDRG